VARRGCLRKEGSQFGVFDTEMLQQRMDALERKAQAYSDSKWRWTSKIDSVVEWMSWLLRDRFGFVICMMLSGVFIYYGTIYGGFDAEFFGDGWLKDLALRIFPGMRRIYFVTMIAPCFFDSDFFFWATVKFFFYFVKFIVHLIFFIIRGCIFVHLVFLRVYSYRIFPIFFNFFQKKYTERQIDVLLRRPVAADSSNLVLFNAS